MWSCWHKASEWYTAYECVTNRNGGIIPLTAWVCNWLALEEEERGWYPGLSSPQDRRREEGERKEERAKERWIKRRKKKNPLQPVLIVITMVTRRRENGNGFTVHPDLCSAYESGTNHRKPDDDSVLENSRGRNVWLLWKLLFIVWVLTATIKAQLVTDPRELCCVGTRTSIWSHWSHAEIQLVFLHV